MMDTDYLYSATLNWDLSKLLGWAVIHLPFMLVDWPPKECVLVWSDFRKNWKHAILCQIVLELQFQNSLLILLFNLAHRASENVDAPISKIAKSAESLHPPG